MYLKIFSDLYEKADTKAVRNLKRQYAFSNVKTGNEEMTEMEIFK